MKYVLWLAVFSVGACANVDMPANVRPADAALWSAVSAAWMDGGHAGCTEEAPREVVVDAITFEELCTVAPLVPPTAVGGRATCADASWNCLMACAIDAPDGGSQLMVLSEGWWERPGYLRQVRAHEMLHVLAACTGVSQEANAAHDLANVWAPETRDTPYAMQAFTAGS